MINSKYIVGIGINMISNGDMKYYIGIKTVFVDWYVKCWQPK